MQTETLADLKTLLLASSHSGYDAKLSNVFLSKTNFLILAQVLSPIKDLEK